MQNFSLFDIIGPRMVGPSSSHTAGAAKLGHMAWKIARGDVKEAELTLYGSFATTGRGHGTDKALIAGILGLAPDDARLRYSMLLAQEAGVDYSWLRRFEQGKSGIRVETLIGLAKGLGIPAGTLSARWRKRWKIPIRGLRSTSGKGSEGA